MGTARVFDDAEPPPGHADSLAALTQAQLARMCPLLSASPDLAPVWSDTAEAEDAPAAEAGEEAPPTDAPLAEPEEPPEGTVTG